MLGTASPWWRSRTGVRLTLGGVIYNDLITMIRHGRVAIDSLLATCQNTPISNRWYLIS
jgi:hypothetical protein